LNQGLNFFQPLHRTKNVTSEDGTDEFLTYKVKLPNELIVRSFLKVVKPTYFSQNRFIIENEKLTKVQEGFVSKLPSIIAGLLIVTKKPPNLMTSSNEFTKVNGT